MTKPREGQEREEEREKMIEETEEKERGERERTRKKRRGRLGFRMGSGAVVRWREESGRERRRSTESCHGRRSRVVLLPPRRREGEPRGGRPVLSVAGPEAIAEQGAVRQQQPVVDEAKMGGEGEQRQQQGKGKRKACLVLPCGHGLAGVHHRA